jgi:hypothetical protein
MLNQLNDPLQIQIDLTGHVCNTWPGFYVAIDRQQIYNGFIRTRQSIKLEVESPSPEFIFSIGMEDKKFGQENIWDTKVDKFNKIIEDKKIEIHDIKFNDVSILDILRKNPYQIKFTDQQKKEEVPNPLYLDNEICYNGAWRCDVSLPIYNWIIVKKFKQDIQPGISEFSDYSKLFHYSKEEKIIKEIKELLKL